MKDHIIFDFSDATTILDSDSVGAFVRANDGTLITKHAIAEATYAGLITQGLILKSKLPGVVGNSYSFTVIDTTPGALSYTEIAGAIVVDLHNNVTTLAQVVTLLASSAYVTAVAGAPAGNIVVASILSLAGGTDSSYHQHLDVYSAMADGLGNALTSHADSGTQALDVHVTNPIPVNVDINGIYNNPNNLLPANVGLIGSSRAAAGLANQTLQFTGAGVASDGVATANIVAQDVNAFGMMWNGSSWDRVTGAAATGLNVNLTNTSISVTQGTSPWVTSASQSGTWTVGLSEDHNYGVVGANTLRTAAQIGNATGAADFGAGVTSAQTLRVVLASDDSITTSDAALANVAIQSNTNTLSVANTAQAAYSSVLSNRKYAWLYNYDNNKIFIGGASVTAANGFPISPGVYIEMRAGAAVPINFIGSTGKLPEIRLLQLS